MLQLTRFLLSILLLFILSPECLSNSIEQIKFYSNMEELRSILTRLNQDHILIQIPELSESHPIFKQLSKLDLASSIRNFESARASSTSALDSSTISPVDKVFNWQTADKKAKKSIQNIGKECIQQGKAAAVILSGGQGTRLGFAGPKGMYDMGLISGKSIFQLHIDRIAKIRILSRTSSGTLPTVPIYIMTSDMNDAIIRDYFLSMNFFGYPKEDIFFFEQGLEPCLTFDGKIIIDSANSLSLAPDGNGGIYNALKKSGAMDDMTRRGVEHLHIYGIDNVLTKSVDPAFLGVCIANKVECGNKVVWRASKAEKVGVTVAVSGKMNILEYSEIPADLAEADDSEGKLVFGAANICNHYMTVDFLSKKVLPTLSSSYHLATKRIPYMDPTTRTIIAPTQNNGVKLEMFIFDVFPLAEEWIVMEVSRDDEFAPVKNEPGNPVDSPDSARAMISAQAKSWLVAAGAIIVNDSSSAMCEICSSLSYDGEGLESYSGRTVELPCFLK